MVDTDCKPVRNGAVPFGLSMGQSEWSSAWGFYPRCLDSISSWPTSPSRRLPGIALRKQLSPFNSARGDWRSAHKYNRLASRVFVGATVLSAKRWHSARSLVERHLATNQVFNVSSILTGRSMSGE